MAGHCRTHGTRIPRPLLDLNGADFVVVVQVAGDFQPEMGAGLALHPDKP
jgi:hypothetical protein